MIQKVIFGLIILSNTVYAEGMVLDEHLQHKLATFLNSSAANTALAAPRAADNDECQFDEDCGDNGECKLKKSKEFPEGINKCVCTDCYLTVDGEDFCSYKQTKQTPLFFISLFVGALGVDWCYAAAGNGCWTCIGVLKGFTAGGLGIWWLVDWIRIASDDWEEDGAEYAICSW